MDSGRVGFGGRATADNKGDGRVTPEGLIYNVSAGAAVDHTPLHPPPPSPPLPPSSLRIYHRPVATCCLRAARTPGPITTHTRARLCRAAGRSAPGDEKLRSQMVNNVPTAPSAGLMRSLVLIITDLVKPKKHKAQLPLRVKQGYTTCDSSGA